MGGNFLAFKKNIHKMFYSIKYYFPDFHILKFGKNWILSS